VGLEVEHVLSGRAALEIEEDDAFGAGRAEVALGERLEGQECGGVKEAAEEGEPADFERFAAGWSGAGTAWAAKEGSFVLRRWVWRAGRVV